MFYAIGWTKGREARTFGWVDARGAATVKETKAELMRLAVKYDAEFQAYQDQLTAAQSVAVVNSAAQVEMYYQGRVDAVAAQVAGV